ncbi:MAG: FAD-binding protein [Myxococcota bacterium]|nr:FAD-binding protein [Myxococcota bacterium]
MGEVLVIGGGMAGAIAALSAQRAGARVQVVRRSYGATALSSGAVDVAPDVTAPGGDLRAHLIPIQQAAEQLARVRPLHPYAVLRASLGRLEESLRFAQGHLDAVLAPMGERNLLLPTPAGTAKPTALAQRSQVGAELTSLPDRFAVVAFTNLPHFDARWVAAGLRQTFQALGRDVQPVVVTVDFWRQLEDALRSPYELALLLEEKGAVERLAQALSSAVPAGIDTVLLPPFLGRTHARLAEALSAASGLRCVETVATSPSVPGVRLQEALDRALGAAGITVLEAEVQPVAFAGGPFALTDGRSVHADAVVLATGKFIGGGIVRERHFFEPLFSLPVFAGARVLGEEFVGDLLGDQVVSDHLAFRAGVRVDASLQPVGVDGRAVSPHLFAAGAVIAGYDPATDKSGLGVAIFTGYLAGEAAARVRLPG